MSLRPLLSSLSLAALVLPIACGIASCSGDEFTACENCAAGTGGTGRDAGSGGSSGSAGSAGRASGGSGGGSGGDSGSGGRGSGGTSGTGSTTDGSATGGAGGTAGSAGAEGSGGSGGVEAGTGFPGTRILDRFDDADGPLGAAWVGNRSSFAIDDAAMTYVSGGCAPVLWETAFGVEQEVFATLSRMNLGAQEINLILKAQDLVECELIEVLYSPARRRLELHYCTGGSWQIDEGIPLTLMEGDQLGARYLADGQVHVFVNGVRVTIFDAAAYPHKAAGGRIGVNCLADADGTTAWDDFGGG